MTNIVEATKGDLARIFHDIENDYVPLGPIDSSRIGSIFSYLHAAWSPYRSSRPHWARADFIRAAALIVAEIERLDRAAANASTEKQEGDN